MLARQLARLDRFGSASDAEALERYFDARRLQQSKPSKQDRHPSESWDLPRPGSNDGDSSLRWNDGEGEENRSAEHKTKTVSPEPSLQGSGESRRVTHSMALKTEKRTSTFEDAAHPRLSATVSGRDTPRRFNLKGEIL